MKIHRTGKNRNQTPATLVEKNISFRKRHKYHRFWDNSKDTVTFRVSGKTRSSEYNYDVTLNLSEMMNCLTVGAEQRCETRAEKALALASIAALDEILRLPIDGGA